MTVGVKRRPNRALSSQRCEHCGSMIWGYGVKGLCRACDQYVRRHGRLPTAEERRPGSRRQIDRDVCLNCRRPRQAGEVFEDGRCEACAGFRLRHGSERPSAFWGDGRYGWCACGEPANHKLRVRLRRHGERVLTLCDACLEMESEEQDG